MPVSGLIPTYCCTGSPNCWEHDNITSLHVQFPAKHEWRIARDAGMHACQRAAAMVLMAFKA